MDGKYAKLRLNPPFTPIGGGSFQLLDPIPFSMSLLDRNPPTLKNIPAGIPAAPTGALGYKWIEKIKLWRINKVTEMKPIIAPAFDIAPYDSSFKI